MVCFCHRCVKLQMGCGADIEGTFNFCRERIRLILENQYPKDLRIADATRLS
jgi:hypothetical protein